MGNQEKTPWLRFLQTGDIFAGGESGDPIDAWRALHNLFHGLNAIRPVSQLLGLSTGLDSVTVSQLLGLSTGDILL